MLSRLQLLEINQIFIDFFTITAAQLVLVSAVEDWIRIYA